MSGDPWVLGPADADYPAQLGELDEPDGPVLRGFGRRDAIAGLDRGATVTVVGSRRPTSYGLRMAERLAGDLALTGVTIVSGMAIGIDAAAHRGALAGGGVTIAVLAGGPDVVYPRRHRHLYEQICASGAVVSDQPVSTPVFKGGFRLRNRLMAALAAVVVIVEAAEPSGTLITADDAIDLGRELGAVPGQVGVRVAEGTNQRIRDGAALIRGAQDVLDLLGGVGTSAPGRRGPSLEPDLIAALELLTGGASSPERLALAGSLGPREAAVALARLELLGYASRDAHGSYAPTGLEPVRA